ncbi:MAG: biotin--[acetyl-CoA-carboxylase] ligase [Trichodesmium sp.]
MQIKKLSEFNPKKFTDSISNIQTSKTKEKPTTSSPKHLHIYSSLPSTNQTLWEKINSGALPGTTVIATQQTAGRGQWGRKWISSIGGLYISVAIAPNIPISQTPQLTLSTAWGIASNLQNHNVPVKIKWPNDLILENRKLGGILTETRIKKAKIAWAVIGVGINWSNTVPETGINLQSYYRNQPQPEISSLEKLAAIIFQGIDCGIKELLASGIDNILPDYNQLLINIGQEISVKNQIYKIVEVTSTGELKVKIKSDPAIPETQSSHLSSEIYLKPGEINLGYGQK